MWQLSFYLNEQNVVPWWKNVRGCDTISDMFKEREKV